MTNHRDGRPADTRSRVRYVIETSWGAKIALDATDDGAALHQFHNYEPYLVRNKGLKKTLVREIRTVVAEGRL